MKSEIRSRVTRLVTTEVVRCSCNSRHGCRNTRVRSVGDGWERVHDRWAVGYKAYLMLDCGRMAMGRRRGSVAHSAEGGGGGRPGEPRTDCLSRFKKAEGFRSMRAWRTSWRARGRPSGCGRP